MSDTRRSNNWAWGGPAPWYMALIAPKSPKSAARDRSRKHCWRFSAVMRNSLANLRRKRDQLLLVEHLEDRNA